MADQKDPFGLVLEEARHVSYQPTTMAYARMLLAPYQQALAQSNDPAALKQWITQAFPATISEHLLEEIDQSEEEMSGEQIRDFILEQMASNLIGPANDHFANNDVDIAVLPWDVVDTIEDHWAPLFGIDKTSKTLPVTVTIGPQQFTHNLTLEQAMGLILFSRVTNVNYHPIMYGVPLTYFDKPDEQTRFDEMDIEPHFPSYRVTIGGQVYQFTSPDFMHGFSTGAMWAGVDHHTHWSNLHYMVDANTQPAPLKF